MDSFHSQLLLPTVTLLDLSGESQFFPGPGRCAGIRKAARLTRKVVSLQKVVLARTLVE